MPSPIKTRKQQRVTKDIVMRDYSFDAATERAALFENRRLERTRLEVAAGHAGVRALARVLVAHRPTG